MPDNDAHGGGLDGERTRRYQLFDKLKRRHLGGPVIASQVYQIVPLEEESGHYRIRGRDFLPISQVYVAGRYCPTTYLHDDELAFFYPDELESTELVVVQETPPAALTRRAASSLAITSLDVLTNSPLRTGQAFALAVVFQAAPRTPVQILQLTVQFPDGQLNSQTYPLTEEQNRAGRVILEDFAAATGGSLIIEATLIDDAGNADYLERLFAVLPSNPLQVYAFPEHYALAGGKGAAIFDPVSVRYYCHTQLVVSNGNPYSVTVGPLCRCRVSDAGLGELAHFYFVIDLVTIPPNSTRILSIYTYHSGSEVYDLFKEFGDAKFEYWLVTTDGEKYDWTVFVAMAQVGVTANFVGSFSSLLKFKVRQVIDTWANAIYNQVNCMFSPNTPLLEIPANNPAWSAYRDIEVFENKDGDCTDSDEADDLRDDWSSPGSYHDRIDIFFVETFSGAACSAALGGFSPVDGPASKAGSTSGIVIDLNDMNILFNNNAERLLGLIIAHEVGHYLGLEHSLIANNFMLATGGASNTGIQPAQWKIMREHFYTRRLNP